MPGTLTSDLVGKIPSLEKGLYLADAIQTPITARMRKGETIDQDTHTYYIERVKSRTAGGVTDGTDVTTFDGQRQQYEATIRPEVFQRSIKLGFLAAGTGTAPVDNKWAAMRSKETIELRRDMESEMVSTQESAADSGSGSKFRGLGKWLQSTVQTDQPLNAATLTPADQIDAATAVGSFLESTLSGLLQARWDNCGMSSELALYCGSAVKAQISTFNRVTPVAANYAAIVRSENSEGRTKELISGVDLYAGDFGSVEIMLGYFMPTIRTGYLLDFDQCKILPRKMELLGKSYTRGVAYADLTDDGGGRRAVLRCAFTYHVGDPAAHCKLALAAS